MPEEVLPGDAIPAGAAASREVLGRGLLYTAAAAAPVLSNAVVTPIVTRSLGAEAYGVVAVALVVVQVGMIVAGLGFAAAITRHGILEESGLRGARGLVLRGAMFSFAFAAIGVATARWTHSWFTFSAPGVLALALSAAAGFAIVVSVQAYLRILDRPAPFVTLALTSGLGGPLAGILLVRLVQPSPELYLLGLCGGYVATGMIGLLLVLRDGRPVLDAGDTWRALRIGLPTVPHQVAIYLAGGTLVLVAAKVFGAGDAGRLQLAVLIGSAPGILTSSLNNAWAPIVFRAPPEHRAEVLEHTGRNIGYLTALAAGFVALSAPILLSVVAPASYDPRSLTPATGLAAAGTVLSVLYLCNVHLVFISGRSAGLAVVTPASMLLGATVALFAAEAIGLQATAVGMTVTYGAMATGTAFLARRVSDTRWRWQMILAPTALGMALCALGAVLPYGTSGDTVRVVLAVAALIASLGVLRRGLAS